jgi:hypothetical protein
MKTQTNKSLFVAALLMSAALNAHAQNVHFKGEPTVTDNGTNFTVCVSLAGLGNQDVIITIEATGLADTTCINPSGIEAPGQNRIPFSTSITTVVRSTQIKNGTVTVCATTPGPDITAKEAGCPNNNWTARIDDVEFESAMITVRQGGQVVLEEELDGEN